MTDLVSIIVPIYNVEDYLEECINSIINQSYKNIEIILVDDGSTDSSFNICKKYQEMDSRIKVFHKENGGLSSARNYGISLSTGEYVTFIDSDDFIDIDYVLQLLTVLKLENAEIAICDLTSDSRSLVHGVTEKYYKYNSHDALFEIFAEKKFTTSASCKLFSRTMFENIQFPVGKVFEDYATIYKLFDSTNRIAYVNIPKYYYRYNTNGITRGKFKKNQLDYFVISDEIRPFLLEKYPDLINVFNDRETRYAISMLRSFQKLNYKDKITKKYLINKIQKNILHYLRSDYKLTSKMYGLFMVLFKWL